MDESLRTGLIMFAITAVVGALSWLVQDLRSDVKTLLLSNENRVSTEQHNALAQSLREGNAALARELSELKVQLRGKGVIS